MAIDTKVIEKGWTSLRLAALPPETPRHQLLEMRRMFYAGAQHLLNAVTSATLLDPGIEETEADLRQMEAIERELNDFGRAVMSGEA